MESKHHCTLTDAELSSKAQEWIDKLIKSGGKDFTMFIPARPNEDTDLILSEIVNRFEAIQARCDKLEQEKAAIQQGYASLKDEHYELKCRHESLENASLRQSELIQKEFIEMEALKDKGDKLARQARTARLSFTAHPSYTGEPNDEWTNMVEGLDAAIAEWKGEKEPITGGMPKLDEALISEEDLKDWEKLSAEETAQRKEAIEWYRNPAGQQRPVWVKATERMPAHNLGVLVLIPGEDNHITSGMWDISNKWVLLDEYRTPDCEVTHWMPLPGLPEGVERNEMPEWFIDTIKKTPRSELGLDESDGEKEVLKVGLKFRSKVAPLCSYEVVKIFPKTKEFKVKETRECQVSGTTCYEIWSIEGFEKYYNLDVYYIQKGG